MFTVTLSRPLDLDGFVVDLAQHSPNGLHLYEVVVAALKAGFPSKERGDITRRVRASIKRLLKSGRVHRMDDLIVA